MTGTPPTAEYRQARQRLDGRGHGQDEPPDPGDPDDRLVDSPFRRYLRLQPKLESQLRALARAQATQPATSHQPAAISSRQAAAILASIPIKTTRCPGEYGPDKWREHCPPPPEPPRRIP